MKGPRRQRLPLLGITVRSKWEANIARLLEYLRRRGDILRWDYEAETFDFRDLGPTKRARYKQGPFQYRVDFRVWWPKQAEPEIWEVKGRELPGDKTRMLRMKKHYPEAFERIRLIDRRQYTRLQDGFARLVEGWQR